MEVKRVADLPKRLTVTDVEMSEEVLTITAVSTQGLPMLPALWHTSRTDT